MELIVQGIHCEVELPKEQINPLQNSLALSLGVCVVASWEGVP